MDEKCVFDEGESFCVALVTKKCEGCKFYKTKNQYFLGQMKAIHILKQKNLIAKKKIIGKTPIMSTEFRRSFIGGSNE